MANSSSLHFSHIHSILCKLEPYDDFDTIEERNQSMIIGSSEYSNEFPEIHDGSNLRESNILGRREQQALNNTINFQNINMEEEINTNKELEDNLGKDAEIEPIIENIENEYDEVNESFFHDNKNLLEYNFKEKKENIFNNIFNEINNYNSNNNNQNNTVIYSNSNLNEIMGFGPGNNILNVDENDISKIKRSLMYIKYFNNKSSLNSTNSVTKDILNPNNNKSVLNDNKKLFNVTKQAEDFITQNIGLNLSSCQLTCHSKKCKRGRKQILSSGIKTEILDKTFLREFKKYLRLKKKEFKNIFAEDIIFWNEFLESKDIPFSFTQFEKKIEFKAYNKNLMNFIFSRAGANTLYTRFISETKDLKIDKIFSKKAIKKSPDNYTILFYKYYRNNLNRLFSQEYSESDIIIDELDINNVSIDLVNNSFH